MRFPHRNEIYFLHSQAPLGAEAIQPPCWTATREGGGRGGDEATYLSIKAFTL